MSTTKISNILQQAVTLHQQGQFDAAETIYQQVLQTEPEHFDALQLLGVIARQRGDARLAVTRLRQAIAIDAQQAIAHGNLGAALQDLGLSEEALASYDRALQIKPDYAMVWNNRGNVLRSLGKLAAALHHYDKALEYNPRYAGALLNRGICLQDMDEHQQALQDFDEALQLNPNDAAIHFARAYSLQCLRLDAEAVAAYEQVLHLQAGHLQAWCNRGICLQKIQEFETALDSFAQALKIKSDYGKAHLQSGHVLRLLGRDDAAIKAYQTAASYCSDEAELAQITYALAALGATATPSASPPAYVADLFDQYAPHFDQHLLEDLHYQVPALLSAAVNKYASKNPGNYLDLGCGTGLCAPYLRANASKLTGIDLSERMLAKAKSTGLYDELHCAEIGDWLQLQDQDFDLIIAADVFVYIGDLEPVFAAASRVMQPEAVLGFSVEVASEDADYLLRPSQRYAHGYAYLQRLAQLHGFAIAEASQQIARKDKGEDILAHILVMIKK
ncbi:tetratricopeptide repeat protein [Undibacterium pigrum]|uniref:Putative TPR repeat methyltransferase n=1 Tax=Undibacterium pigrum TaxID=401470 RepID=A0A318JAU2_9BURK|nr:tetratricopeptide repeat protein [Undibacterium pigrum]PXX45157.1 putative TPR repeat methyltransferase [Undibacterium pigrum]